MKRLASVLVVAALSTACPGGGGGAGNCPEPEVLTGPITGEVIVGAKCGNWVVPSSVTVANAGSLVIKPGTTLSFAAGARLLVEGGKIAAVGTEDAPIILTGDEKTRGYWGGLILFKASSSENRLDHVTIEYAGGAQYTWANAVGGLVLTGDTGTPSRLAVSNSTISNSSGYGIASDEHGELASFSGNTLTENAEGAAHIVPVSVGQLAAGNSYSGNAKDRVVVKSGSITGAAATFQAIDVPFQTGSLSVSTDGSLTVSPGVTLKFDSGAQLKLEDGGKLLAQGTASAPILFTGAEAVPSFWKGINVFDSGSSENVLAFATVEYAGIKDTWASAAAGVALTHQAARLQIHNTTIRHGDGYGLYVDEDAQLGSFSDNLLTGQKLGAAYVFPNSAGFLDGSSSYLGNATGRDFVRVATGTVQDEASWSALDVPYRMDSVKVDTALTIEPGAKLEFEVGKSLMIEANGRLTAVGTAAQRIVFTSAPGESWVGLLVYNSIENNRVEYSHVSNAGVGAWTWSSAPHGAIRLFRGNVSVANSHFANNAGYAIWQHTDGTTATGCTSATFEANAAGTSNGPCI